MERGCLRIGAVGLVLVVLAVLFGAWFWIWPSTDAIERRWIAEAGFDPAVVYLLREANATARRIEELAALLGIEVSPQTVPQRPRRRVAVGPGRGSRRRRRLVLGAGSSQCLGSQGDVYAPWRGGPRRTSTT